MPHDWLTRIPGMRRDESLSRHSQYGIGGPADWFLQVTETAVLADLVRRCHEEQVAITVIGAGSNTLVLDGGIRGVVIELADKRMSTSEDGSVELQGGCMLPRAALDCAKLGLAGLEFGIGVPGTCGAAVRGNAGAFGREVRDGLIDCDAVSGSGDIVTLTAAQCEFAYRTSVFKTTLRDHIVVAARFTVSSDDPAAVRARTDEISAKRKATQPYGIRSLGSVFTNPPGDHAGRLIEAAGLKGTRHGGAEISPIHANFIVNTQSARAADVLALVNLAHDTVLEKFGVDLEPEIVIVGEAEKVGA